MKRDIAQRLFPRYPTKRACLLPVLHLVQHEYNWIPAQAMQEVAEFLGLAPAEVLDTASFYEEYWLRKKGKYLVQVCRSLSCEICGSDRIVEGLIEKLGVEVGETTDDDRYTLVELECLGSCGTAPVALVNDVQHENITLDGLMAHLSALPDDPHDYHDPFLEAEGVLAGAPAAPAVHASRARPGAGTAGADAALEEPAKPKRAPKGRKKK
jgi:NADH-quinone oxidoreductase subunit E